MSGEEEDMLPYAADVSLKVLYTIVAALGMCGNGGIIYVFIAKRIQLNPFKTLLLNLAIADFLAATSTWPYIYIDLTRLREMPNSDFMCGMTFGNVLYWLASIASIFTLTWMSVNRYLLICHPRAARYFTKRVAAVLVFCLIWPTAAIISAPSTFSFIYLPEYALCVRQWPKGFNGTVFGILTFLLGFVYPISVITFTFIATRKYFWSRHFGTISRSEDAVRRNRKAALFMALLIAAFFACWSPFFVYWVISKAIPSAFSTGIAGHYTATRAIRVLILVSLVNTVTNPIIYGLRGDAEFKASFRALRKFICYCKQYQNKVERIETVRSSKTSSV